MSVPSPLCRAPRARLGSRPILAIVLGLLTSGCGASPAPADRLTIAVEAEPASLDPRFGTDQASARVYQLVYNGLVRIDRNLRVSPDLVEAWEAPDPRTLVLRLRTGVRFHDGRPLSSADVRYTLESILDPATGSPRRADFEAIERIETPDARSVVLRLSRPFAPLLANLNVGLVGIIPADPSLNHRRHPVGTGPFRFVSRRRDEDVWLEANGDYWQGAPAFRQLRLKVVPTETGRALEMLKGSVDAVVNDLPPALVERFVDDPRFVVLASPSNRYAYLGFNFEDPLVGRLPVRQALAQAVDIQALIRHHLYGRARPASGLLAPLLWGYHDPGPIYPHDPRAAARRLEQAGFPDPDGEGPKPRFTLQYKCSTSETSLALATILQEQLRAVGIDLDIRSYEWATFYDDIVHGRFQVFSLRWTSFLDPDVMRLRLHSQMAPPRGFNRGRYRNAELDRLLDDGVSESDPAHRAALYARAQELVARELPYLSLWHEDNVAVLSSRVRGFELMPAADFWAFASVRLEPSGPQRASLPAGARTPAGSALQAKIAAAATGAPEPLRRAAAAAGRR